MGLELCGLLASLDWWGYEFSGTLGSGLIFGFSFEWGLTLGKKFEWFSGVGSICV